MVSTTTRGGSAAPALSKWTTCSTPGVSRRASLTHGCMPQSRGPVPGGLRPTGTKYVIGCGDGRIERGLPRAGPDAAARRRHQRHRLGGDGASGHRHRARHVDAHVHGAGPALRPGDRRGARAGLDRRVRRAGRRAGRLARARQRPAAEHHQDGRRHRRRPVDRIVPRRRAPRAPVHAGAGRGRAGPGRRHALGPRRPHDHRARRVVADPVDHGRRPDLRRRLVTPSQGAHRASSAARRQRPPGDHRGELRGVLLALPGGLVARASSAGSSRSCRR